MSTVISRLLVDKSQSNTRNRILDLRIVHKDLDSLLHKQLSVAQNEQYQIVCKTFVYLYARDEVSSINYETVAASVSRLNGLLALSSITQAKSIDLTPFNGVMMIPMGGTLTISQIANNSDTFKRYVEVIHD
jgi:hypothetical protein